MLSAFDMVADAHRALARTIARGNGKKYAKRFAVMES